MHGLWRSSARSVAYTTKFKANAKNRADVLVLDAFWSLTLLACLSIKVHTYIYLLVHVNCQTTDNVSVSLAVTDLRN